MRVTVNTPLENLPEYEMLSAWARNVCQSRDIFSIGDLLMTPEADLLRIKNCGRKTLEELQSVKMRYSSLSLHDTPAVENHSYDEESLHVRLGLIVRDYRNEVPTEVLYLYDRYTENYDRLPGVLVRQEWNFDDVFEMFTWGEFMALRPYLTRFLMSVVHEAMDSGYMKRDIRSVRRIAGSYVEQATTQITYHILNELPSVVYNNLDCEYRVNFSRMPTRTRVVFSGLDDFMKAVPFVSGAKDPRKEDFPKCGDKSYESFMAFLEKERLILRDTLTELQPNRNPEYYLESYCKKYVHLYPFLSYPEQAQLGLMEILGRGLPKFTIWYKYLMWKPNPQVRLLCDYLGLNEEKRRFSSARLSEKYDLTRERIRQICANGVPADELLLQIRKSISSLFDAPLVGEWDGRWSIIAREENMHAEARELMALYALANADYGLLEVPGDPSVSFLVNRHKIGLVKLRSFLNKLETVYALRRYNLETLDLKDYVRTHLNASLSEQDLESVCGVIAEYYGQRGDVCVSQDGELVFSNNSVDKREAVEQVLRAHGEPMSIDDITVAYNRSHPNDQMTSQGSVHSYLLRNPHIVSLGKRGMYALKEWPGIYHGCLKDHIPTVLEQSDRPLTVKELTAKVMELFPGTNEKSVSSLLYVDGDERYVQFEGNLIGLKGRDYGLDNKLKVRKIKKRGVFADRFEDFKRFVDESGRLPYTNQDEYESSLDRWRKNVLTGKIETLPGQTEMLREYLLEVESLPQNGQEYIFKEKCDRTRRIVEETGHLPHNKENSGLYIWFRKALRGKGTWNDNRERYFADLLDWLAKTAHINLVDM